MLLRTACVLGVALISAVSARTEEPRAIIERAVKAMGGEEVLNANMKSPHILASRGYLIPQGIDMKLPTSEVTLVQPANKLRSIAKIEYRGRELEMVTVVDGDKGWRKAPSGKVTEFTDKDAADRREMRHRNRMLHVLPLLHDKSYTLTMQEDSVVDGNPAWTVKVACMDFTDSLLHFDKASGYLVKLTYTDRQGKKKETYFSEYREMGRYHDEKAVRDSGLETEAKALLMFLRRLAPEPARLAAVKDLVRKLGDDSFEVRERAAKDLIEIGKICEPLLRQATKEGDAEVTRRATECLTQIGKRTSDATLIAAIRVVGWTQPKDGAEVLLALLPWVAEQVAAEARAVLVVYAGGKPDPAIVKALEDPDPVRRAAAKAVLGKDGGEYLKQPGRTVFLRGFKDSLRYRYDTDGKTIAENEVAEFRFVNRLDPKVFEKPME